MMVVMLNMVIVVNILCFVFVVIGICFSMIDMLSVLMVGVVCSMFSLNGLVDRMFEVKIGSSVVVFFSSIVNRFNEIMFSIVGVCWMKVILVKIVCKVIGMCVVGVVFSIWIVVML